MKHAHVIISGRVQGVSFRFATLQAAKEKKITGWVQNLPDGTVEAVFQGPEERINAMLEWCRQGPPLARVTNLAIDRRTRGDDFDQFEIRYC